jgi:hypothetical protein
MQEGQVRFNRLLADAFGVSADCIHLCGERHDCDPGLLQRICGPDNDIRHRTDKQRAARPDVTIHAPTDCGVGVPISYDTYKELGIFTRLELG